MTPNPLKNAPTAPTPPTAGPRPLSGRVLDVDGRSCLVSAEGHLQEAQRAPSCLIDLMPGDRVALWLDDDAALFVLAVLARDPATASSPMHISAPAGLSIDTGTQAELKLSGGGLHMQAARCDWALGQVQITADEVRGSTRSLHWVSQFVQHIVDSLHLVAERSFRHVRTLDQQRCGHLDIAAEQLIHARAEHTLITARKLTRLDGSQIQVG